MKTFISILLCLYTAFPAHTQSRVLHGRIFSINTYRTLTPEKQIQDLVDTSEMSAVSVCLLNSLSEQQKGTPCTYGTITDVEGNFQLSIPAAWTKEYRYIELTSRGATPNIIELSDNAYDTVNVFYVNLEYSNLPVVPLERAINKNILVGKPAIYLYPTQNKTSVSVKHVFKGTIGTTYPAYNDGWEVIADTNGTLYNTKDKRQYEYLFWDGTHRFPEEHYDFKTGFVVKKEESQAFLWEKLAFIGLNNKEINDFVVYWLPQLEQNEQNFIHFRINDDIDHSSVLTVTPQPDSRIRLFMEFKPVSANFHIPPQSLQTCSRKGFTLVEWGGAKLEETLSLQ